MLFKISNITNDTREKCRLVLENSKYVKINKDAINKFADELSKEIKNWEYSKLLDSSIHYTEEPIKAVWYLFVLDSINFCFWGDSKLDKWTLKYNEKEVSGYKALAIVLKREAENSPLFVYPYYWAKIFKKEFMRIIYPLYKDLFYLRGELKLIEERITNLRELGENIFEKPISDIYKSIFWRELHEKNIGSKIKEEENDPYRLTYKQKNNPQKIFEIIIQANRDVNKFIEIIIETFTNFRDTADYYLNNGRVISIGFYKRAQLLAHDLYLLYQYYLKNKPEVIQNNEFIKYLEFKNIGDLTAFADYKIPQLLQNKGILIYSEDLLNEIKEGKLIPSRDTKEVEIRAATIIAVEELSSRLKIYPAFLDNILWNISKTDNFIYPHHKTITTYY